MDSILERILYFGSGIFKRRFIMFVSLLVGVSLLLKSWGATFLNFEATLGNQYFTVGTLSGLFLIWIAFWLWKKAF